MEEKKLNIEEAMKRLQEISKILDSDQEGIEGEFKLFKEASELHKKIKIRLEEMQLEIKEIEDGVNN